MLGPKRGGCGIGAILYLTRNDKLTMKMFLEPWFYRSVIETRLVTGHIVGHFKMNPAFLFATTKDTRRVTTFLIGTSPWFMTYNLFCSLIFRRSHEVKMYDSLLGYPAIHWFAQPWFQWNISDENKLEVINPQFFSHLSWPDTVQHLFSCLVRIKKHVVEFLLLMSCLCPIF